MNGRRYKYDLGAQAGYILLVTVPSPVASGMTVQIGGYLCLFMSIFRSTGTRKQIFNLDDFEHQTSPPRNFWFLIDSLFRCLPLSAPLLCISSTRNFAYRSPKIEFLSCDGKN